MNNFLKKIKDNWLLFFIMIQPIIDVIAYFQTKTIEKSYSWIIRIILIVIMAFFVFKNSKNKKKLLIELFPFAIFFVLHIINLYRINSLNLLLDVKYFVLVFQMPILTIMMIDYVKNRPDCILLIKKGMFYSFLIIFFVIAFSYITNTYEVTYEYSNTGIIGWFTGSNTPSMILCALCPWAICYSFKKNDFIFLITYIIAFVMLYYNATKACYITLVTYSIVMLFNSFIVKKNFNEKITKIIISALIVFLAGFLYKYSFTAINVSKSQHNIELNQKEISKINNKPQEITQPTKPNNSKPNTTTKNVEKTEDQKIVEILKISHIYAELMELHGEEKVVKYMRNNLTPEKLANNRLLKVINAKIETEDSDFLTRVLGAGYSRFAANSYDLETDLDAIFYYYGYLGFGIYMVFILYFLIIAFVKFVKTPNIIRNAEFVTLCYLIPLLVGGGQYSGAFLRKPNANIYLSLFLVLMYVLCKQTSNLKKKLLTLKRR